MPQRLPRGADRFGGPLEGVQHAGQLCGQRQVLLAVVHGQGTVARSRAELLAGHLDRRYEYWYGLLNLSSFCK